MTYLLPIFKAVSLIFAVASSATGVQAIVDPVGFSTSFGLALNSKESNSKHGSLTSSYISLMGVRQLGTGLIISTFAYQNKWKDIATILGIIGIVVAGTDAIYLSRAGLNGKARFHAIPGFLIAALAWVVLWYDV
jgi:hypothetical protein